MVGHAGANNKRNPIIRGECEPVAQESIFGWVLSGRIAEDFEPPIHVESSLLIQNQQLIELNDQLETKWKVENFGIDENEGDEKNIKKEHNGERYEISLLWRKNAGVVGDNYAQAKVRLSALRRKLDENEVLKA